jgi:hypothetical protein
MILGTSLIPLDGVKIGEKWIKPIVGGVVMLG